MRDRDASPARRSGRPSPSHTLAELEADAAITALLLPGVVHKIRNLLFATVGSLDLLQNAESRRMLDCVGTARESLQDMRTWLDICGGWRGGDAGHRWLESASVSIGRLGECVGFLVSERDLRFELVVEPCLPGLAVSPVALFRWSAVALRRLLDAIPEGVDGTLVAAAALDGPELVRIDLRHRVGAGFLPLLGELRPFEPDLVELAREDGIGLGATQRPIPAVSISVPLRREAAVPALKSEAAAAQEGARPRRRRSPPS